MKKIMIAMMLMVGTLNAMEYEIARERTTSYEHVEDFIIRLKEITKTKNISISQVGNSEWFKITWIEVVEINIQEK